MSQQLRHFAFGTGFSQDTDDRLIEPGKPRAVENLVQLKNGALAMRQDYDSLGITVPSGNGVKLYDVAEFNGRLVGFGSVTAGTIPTDIYEFVNQPTFAWRPSQPSEFRRLGPVTNVRNMGRLPAQGDSAIRTKIAAGGGLVCLVTRHTSATTTIVHIFDPATDGTVLVQTLSTTNAHVVTVNGVFFIAALVAATVALFRFNPAIDVALVQLAARADVGKGRLQAV